MEDMGIFRTTVGVESPITRGDVRLLADTVVDTGSEFTWVPRTVLESLGIKPERNQGFVVADGRRVDREMGYAIVHAAGTATGGTVAVAAGSGRLSRRKTPNREARSSLLRGRKNLRRRLWLRGTLRAPFFRPPASQCASPFSASRPVR